MTPPASWATSSPRPSSFRRLAGAGADLASARRAGWSRPPAGAGPTPTPGPGAFQAVRDWHHQRLSRAWSVAGTDLLVGGTEHLERPGPLLLVANHQHPRDAQLVRAALPEQLARQVRVLGPRPTRVLARLPRLPGSASPVWLVFGDGEPSADGTVGPFDPAVVALARRWHARVVPVAVRGSFALPTQGTRLSGVLGEDAPRVSVRFGPPVTIHGDATPAQTAERLRAAVLDLVLEDQTTWWLQQQGTAPSGTPAAPWRRVWAATAPVCDGGVRSRRGIWR